MQLKAFLFPLLTTRAKLLPVVCRECWKCVWQCCVINPSSNVGKLALRPPGFGEFQLSGTVEESPQTPCRSSSEARAEEWPVGASSRVCGELGPDGLLQRLPFLSGCRSSVAAVPPCRADSLWGELRAVGSGVGGRAAGDRDAPPAPWQKLGSFPSVPQSAGNGHAWPPHPTSLLCPGAAVLRKAPLAAPPLSWRGRTQGEWVLPGAMLRAGSLRSGCDALNKRCSCSRGSSSAKGLWCGHGLGWRVDTRVF